MPTVNPKSVIFGPQIIARRGPSFEARALRQQVNVFAAANGHTRLMMRIYERAVRELFAGLDRGTPLSQARKRRILAQLREMLPDINRRLERILGLAQAAVIREQFAVSARSLMSEAPLDFDPRIPQARLHELVERGVGGKPLAPYVANMSEQAVREATKIMGAAIIEGKPLRKMVAELMEMGETRRWATTLAHTTFMDSADKARRAVFREFRQVIDFYVVLTALDIRVCPRCAPLGPPKTYKDLRETPRLPVHPRCRCTLSARVKGTEQVNRPAVIDYKVSEGEDPTRGHRVRHVDGTTSTRFTPRNVAVNQYATFNEFFNDQDAAWQRSYLKRQSIGMGEFRRSMRGSA